MNGVFGVPLITELAAPNVMCAMRIRYEAGQRLEHVFRTKDTFIGTPHTCVCAVSLLGSVEFGAAASTFRNCQKPAPKLFTE